MVYENKKKILIFLAILGIGISAYLTYVKLQPEGIACNLGQCDIVQASKYSELFGIPIAIYGLGYYILFITLISANLKKYANYWALWGLLFSSYLTLLELFVLKAICGWCVLSFIVIILINLLIGVKEK